MRANIGIGLPSNLSPTLTQRALAILRTYGTDAHLWLPGVGMVNGITAANFIESNGTSPAAVDGPVGYVGDAGKALGPELVGNSTFDAPGWWSLAGATISGGMLNLVTAGEYVGATRLNTLVVGKVYQVEADVVKNSGTGSVFVGNPSVGVTRATTGKLSGVFVASDTTLEIKRFSGSLDATLDNVSVREIVGAIPATQSTTAAKPLLRQSGGLYSWQFDGTDDRLQLSAVPFQQADDHVVVTSSANTRASGASVVFALAGAGTEVQRCAQIFYNNNVLQCTYIDNAALGGGPTQTATLTLGQTAITSLRKVGNLRAFRVNGALIGSNTVALGATTIGTQMIGAHRNPAANHMQGNIGPVIAIKGTVTDADLLTLEKWVGSLSGVTIA